MNVKNGVVILSWKSKGLSAETSSTSNIAPMLDFYGGGKLRVNFIGGYLNKTNKTAYAYGKLVNIYTVFQLEASSFNINDSTLKTCLFGTVTLTKNADINKYGYSGYGIGFDRR